MRIDRPANTPRNWIIGIIKIFILINVASMFIEWFQNTFGLMAVKYLFIAVVGGGVLYVIGVACMLGWQYRQALKALHEYDYPEK